MPGEYLPNGSLTAFNSNGNCEDCPLYIANRLWDIHNPGSNWGSNINVSGVAIFNRSLTPEEVQKLYNGDMTLKDLNNSGCIFFAPLINDTRDIINGVDGSLSGDTIELNKGNAPPNLIKMMNNLHPNQQQPVKTPIPLGVLVLTLIIPIVLLRNK